MKELREKLVLKVFKHPVPKNFPLFHFALPSQKNEALPIYFHDIYPYDGG